MQLWTPVAAGAGTEAFCSGGDQSVRGKGGYVGADGVPRLNVLDLQVLRHDSSVPSCLHAALLVLLVILSCMLFAPQNSGTTSTTGIIRTKTAWQDFVGNLHDNVLWVGNTEWYIHLHECTLQCLQLSL